MSYKYLADYGPALIGAGYPIIPVRPGQKAPLIANWASKKMTRGDIDKLVRDGFGHAGIGVLTENFPAVDIDTTDPEIIAKVVKWCDRNVGEGLQRTGRYPRLLISYRTDRSYTKLSSKTYTDFAGDRHKLEVLGAGQQYVAFGVHPDTGRPYEWKDRKSILSIRPEDLPVLTQEQAIKLIEYYESIVPSDWQIVTPGRVDASEAINGFDAIDLVEPKSRMSYDQIAKMISNIDPDTNMADWVRVGMALYYQYDGGDDGFALWDEWSSNGTKYRPKEMRHRWDSFKVDLTHTRPVTMGSIVKLAGGVPKKVPPSKPKGFGFLSISSVLDKLGPIDWRVENFFEKNTTGLLFGDAGSYKSFVALDIALHIAAGKDWHGNKVAQGPVIYIAGEGHGGLARRFAAWQQYHETDISKLPIYVSNAATGFCEPERTQEVVKAIDQITRGVGNPAMILIDTLARNFGSGDENSNSDMGAFISNVDNHLRERYTATVMIVHHSGHGNKSRARGATALRAGVDFEYCLTKEKGGLSAKLVCSKMKDAIEPVDTYLQATEVKIPGFEEDITSLIFNSVAPPIARMDTPIDDPDTPEEGEGLKGIQRLVFENIEQEQPVSRKTLAAIMVSDALCRDKKQFDKALLELKKKCLITDNNGVLHTLSS